MKKVERLTQEQEAMLPVIRDKWLKIGLSCEPCDFERAKAGAIMAYKAAGLEPPKLFLVADSPVSGAIMATMLKGQEAQVGDQVRAQVEAQVWAQVGAQVEAQVGDQVWDQVGDQVWDQVWDQVGAQVGDQVGAQVGDQVWAQVGAQVYGAHDANWLGFYNFFSETDTCDTSKLNGLWEIAQSCGWWHPMQGAVIFQHRHDAVHLIDGQLHNDLGPSVHYRDGLSVWSIRGVRVDEQIVMKPETQTIKQINGESNAEIKRIRIERYGWENYLRKTDARVLEERQNDIEATVESLMQAGDMRVLVGACPSTGRVYAMEVDPSCDNCDAAKNYLQGGNKFNLIGAS